ncbi:antitoxin [Jatrophihabitans sp. DSM 45814]
MDLDGLKDKAMDLVHGHKDKVEDGVEKASDLAKDKIGHDDQVEKAEEFIKDKLKDV